MDEIYILCDCGDNVAFFSTLKKAEEYRSKYLKTAVWVDNPDLDLTIYSEPLDVEF